MATKTNVLGKFNIPKSSLSDIYNKAEEYGKQLYRYYSGLNPDENKYWKDELRNNYLKTSSRKNGRYVPGRTTRTDITKKSDDIIAEMTNHIMGYLSKNEDKLEYMVQDTLEQVQTAINNFDNVGGVKSLKKQIDTQKLGKKTIKPEGVIGLQKELQKTLERYLTLKPGECIVNTDNYEKGSPTFDIYIKGTDGTEIVSEVKSNLGNFRILGINSPFKTEPTFVSNLTKNCSIDSDRKVIILSSDSVKNASIELLKNHYNTYQPFIESDSAIKLFTDLFLGKGDNVYLPITARDEEEEDKIGSIELAELNNSNLDSKRQEKVEKYIKSKMSRYMLWYGNK